MFVRSSIYYVKNNSHSKKARTLSNVGPRFETEQVFSLPSFQLFYHHENLQATDFYIMQATQTTIIAGLGWSLNLIEVKDVAIRTRGYITAVIIP